MTSSIHARILDDIPKPCILNPMVKCSRSLLFLLDHVARKSELRQDKSYADLGFEWSVKANKALEPLVVCCTKAARPGLL